MIKFNVTTYNQFTHDLVESAIKQTNAQHQFRELNNESGFSKFVIYGTQETFNRIQDIGERNDGNVISYEYGDE
jgi:hypothetical protein